MKDLNICPGGWGAIIRSFNGSHPLKSSSRQPEASRARVYFISRAIAKLRRKVWSNARRTWWINNISDNTFGIYHLYMRTCTLTGRQVIHAAVPRSFHAWKLGVAMHRGIILYEKSYWLLRHFQYFPIAFHFQILGNRNFNPEFPPEKFSCCRARHQLVTLTRVCREPIDLHALTPSHSTSSVIYHVWLLYKQPQSFARYVFLQLRLEKV